MKKSTKILLKIASIISIILSVVFLLQAMSLLFNIGGYKDYFIELMTQMGIIASPSDVNFQVYMSIFDAIVGILLNSYASGVYLKLSKVNNVLLGSSRVLLYIGVLQCFFLISIIPGIISIIVSCMLKKQENNILTRPRVMEQSPSSIDDITDRIANLKAKKESGQISLEEYNHLLSAIIEESAKQNVLKGQTSFEKVSLKDKIIDIKEKSRNENNVDNEKKDNE